MAFWWLHYSPGKWGKHRNHRNQQEIIAKFSDELAVWRNHRNHKTIPRTIPCIQEHLMSLRCFAASLRRGHFGIPFFPIFLGFYHTFTTEKWRTRKNMRMLPKDVELTLKMMKHIGARERIERWSHTTLQLPAKNLTCD